MRVNFNIDERLKNMAEVQAKSMGLSLSAFIRFLVSRETQAYQAKVDRMIEEAEKDDYEPFSMEQLKEDIKNAK